MTKIELSRIIYGYYSSGSSQLEIKSKVQEYLTGREFECLVLPLSFTELAAARISHDPYIFGNYPQIINSQNPQPLLQMLYQNYINKDIIEILRIGHPDVLQKLITLIAHSSGQLLNYSQLAADCKVSTTMITHYLDVLEHTYVMPVEVKYTIFAQPNIPRALRSFIEVYKPKHAIIINKNLSEQRLIDQTVVHFIPITYLPKLFSLIDEFIVSTFE